MKFFNSQYPNMTIHSNELSIKFVGGVYETTDTKIIQLLKAAGFASESDEKKLSKNNSK